MSDTPLPPEPPKPPPLRPGSFTSPEARLASTVQRLVSILTHHSHAFPVKYDELKSAFWAGVTAARRLEVFASDFFDDLLVVANHPLAVGDRTPAHTGRLREVAFFGALRRLQAGELQDGLTRLRRIADETAATTGATGGDAIAGAAGTQTSAVWPPDVRRDAVLVPDALRRLAESLAPSEPRTAALVEQLVPLLERDPTAATGAAAGMLLHLSAVDPRLHPGYGVWTTVRCRAEVADRRGTTTFSLNRTLETDAPLYKVLAAADAVSRNSGGPHLDRGLQLHLDAEGLDEFVTGESADFAFALLFASEGRSAASLRRLELHPGTAAIGEITADGLVREVAAGPMRAKLRRVWESGARRLYVAAAQETLCRDSLALLAAPGGGSGESGRSGRSGRSGQNGESGRSLLENTASAEAAAPGVARWVGIVPATRLEAVALPHHFVVAKRKPADWLHRIVRRNRVRVELAATALVTLTVASIVYYGPRNPTAVAANGSSITATYSKLRQRTNDLAKEFPNLQVLPRAQDRDSRRVGIGGYCWTDDVDGDGKREVLALAIVPGVRDGETGRILLLCRKPTLEPLWSRWVDAEVPPGDGQNSVVANEWKASWASAEDWDRDGRKDVLVAITNRGTASALTIWSGNGVRALQYLHTGHIKSCCLVPASFVISDPSKAPPDFQSHWSALQCVVGLAYYASGDSGNTLFVIPPWETSAASPLIASASLHPALPVCDAPYLHLRPSLVARRWNNGRVHPDHVEYLPDPTPHLKVCTIEYKAPDTQAEGTLIREFGPGLVLNRWDATDDFWRATNGTIRRDDPVLVRSVEAIRDWDHDHWVER